MNFKTFAEFRNYSSAITMLSGSWSCLD